MRVALVLVCLLLGGCTMGPTCRPHPCAPDEPCDPSSPTSPGGAYEHCRHVYLGVRATTQLAGAFDQERALSALRAFGLEAVADTQTGGVNVGGDPESVYVTPSANATQWSWLHDSARLRSGVSALQSIQLGKEDRARWEGRAEDVLARFENATGLARDAQLRWDPQVGVN